MANKPVILTVDDDPQVLGAIARDLRRKYGEDYRVVRSDSGQGALEAVQELKTRGTPVALLLADQRMPQMDGVAFLSEAMKLFPDSKRALLTAYADTDAAIKAINQSKIHYYLLKPWDPPEEKLYPVLDDLLSDWQAGFRPSFSGIRIVGDRWSAEGHTLRDFLARNQVPYRWLDVEADDEAKELVESKALAPESLPVVIFEDGEMLEKPTPLDVARKAGLNTEATNEFYDLIIVGAGPAGLASGVYGASEGLKVAVLDSEAPGGQAGTSSRIENYLGFPVGLSGGDLARRSVAQARKFGAELITPREVVSGRPQGQLQGRELGGRRRADLTRAHRGDRRAVPQAGRPRHGHADRGGECTTALRLPRRSPARVRTCSSSARATRRGRRRCTWRALPTA